MLFYIVLCVRQNEVTILVFGTPSAEHTVSFKLNTIIYTAVTYIAVVSHPMQHKPIAFWQPSPW